MQLFRDTLPDELLPYKDRLSARFHELRKQVIGFIIEDIIPNQTVYHQQKQELEKKARHPLEAPEPPIVNTLRQKAKDRKLFNFYLQISLLEYAPIAELLGMYSLASLAMNCAPPDSVNMEVLEKYGTKEQKEKWLKPLLNGQIRSAFAMTEPGIASSDATNISSTIERNGDHYLVNGHKFYITGAIRPECKILLFLGKSSTSGSRYSRHSLVLIPRDSVGVKIIRPMAIFGHEQDLAEIIFDNVKVPLENIVLGEGRGFEIAQGRLGPARIHHCMRTVGAAEMALSSMIYRAQNRVAFGSVLSEKDAVRQAIARARIEITKSRQLCYLAAVIADEKGFKEARKYIAMIKVEAPRMALQVVDEAIQLHGAHGIGQDSLLSGLFAGIRTLRVGDGPDIVHLNTIAQMELANGGGPIGSVVSGENINIEKYGKFKNVDNFKESRKSKL